MRFDIAAYLERIGLADRPPVTLAGLSALQAAQLSSIACENLQSLLGEAPDLSPAGIWNKLVAGGRGGTALQLNSLLGSALAALGFAARPLLAWSGPEKPATRTHLAWAVLLDGRQWIVDVGLGDHGPFTPILECGVPQASSGARFRIIAEQGGEKTLQRKSGERWTDLYSYEPAPLEPVVGEGDGSGWSRDIQALPVADLVVSIQRPNGRMSIVNSFAKTEADMGTRVLEFSTAEAFARTIRGAFRLNYSTEELQRVWTAMPRGQMAQASGAPGAH